MKQSLTGNGPLDSLLDEVERAGVTTFVMGSGQVPYFLAFEIAIDADLSAASSAIATLNRSFAADMRLRADLIEYSLNMGGVYVEAFAAGAAGGATPGQGMVRDEQPQ